MSQPPGPALLTFSHPTPPCSYLHFRSGAIGSARTPALALTAAKAQSGSKGLSLHPSLRAGSDLQNFTSARASHGLHLLCQHGQEVPTSHAIATKESATCIWRN